MPRIELSTWIAAPAERCFDLARSVELHERSTAATGERAVAGKTTGLLALGDEVTWRARHFGVWHRLTSRITVYDRPRMFRDEMVDGIFQHLRHEHAFVPEAGGTRVLDRFEFAAPWGILGRIAEALFLTAHMRRFLETRNRELKSVAESARWHEYVPPAA